MNTKYFAVVLAAGNSQRFQGVNKKQFTALCGELCFLHPLKSFVKSGFFSRILLVIDPEDEGLVREALVNSKLTSVEIVYGGKDRNESVSSALNALKEEEGKVFLHDAARAALPQSLLFRLKEASSSYDAVTPVLPVRDSLIYQGNYIRREDAYLVQTPQVFTLKEIRSIYEEGYSSTSTDDYSKALEKGLSCFQVEGDPHLFKLTVQGDIPYLEASIQDLHKLEK